MNKMPPAHRRHRDRYLKRALARNPVRIPIGTRNRLKGTPGAYYTLREARRLILRNRRGEAIDVIDAIMDRGYDLYTALDLSRSACYLAVRRLDYWGITDVNVEWVCSYCHRVKPVEEFENAPWTTICAPCQEAGRKIKGRSSGNKRTIPS